MIAGTLEDIFHNMSDAFDIFHAHGAGSTLQAVRSAEGILKQRDAGAFSRLAFQFEQSLVQIPEVFGSFRVEGLQKFFREVHRPGSTLHRLSGPHWSVYCAHCYFSLATSAA